MNSVEIPSHRVTPEDITTLQDGEVFVFGSNRAGRHGAGAARTAHRKFGAEWGVGTWMTGKCYAIPTKDIRIKTLPLDEIRKEVDRFISFASRRPDYKFLVTELGCGLAGYTPAEIAPMFEGALGQENVSLPLSFWKILTANK